MQITKKAYLFWPLPKTKARIFWRANFLTEPRIVFRREPNRSPTKPWPLRESECRPVPVCGNPVFICWNIFPRYWALKAVFVFHSLYVLGRFQRHFLKSAGGSVFPLNQKL